MQPGPEDRSQELRRLPKRPVRHVASETGSQPSDTRHIQEHPQTADSSRQLYFETLPDPFLEDTMDESAQLHEAPPPPTTPPVFSEEPSLDFPRGTPTQPGEDSFTGDVRESTPRRRSTDVQRPVRHEPETQRRADEVKDRRTAETAGELRRSDLEFANSKPASAAFQLRPTDPLEQFSTEHTAETFLTRRASGAPVTWRVPDEISADSSIKKNNRLPFQQSEAIHDESSPLMSTKEQKVSANKVRSGRGKAVIGMALASGALVAYAFEIGTLENTVNAAAGRLITGGSLLSSLLPWLLVVPAVVLFGVIVWLLAGIIGLRRTEKKVKRPRKDKQPRTPLDQFKAAALRQGVDIRTAYRGWRLLKSTCGDDQSILIDSSLVHDLGLEHREIRAVHLQLLADLLRSNDPAMRLPSVETVLDLLKAVDASPMVRPLSTSGEVVIPGDPGQRKRKVS